MQTKLGLKGLDAKSVRTGPKNIEGCCSIKYAPIAPRENTVSNIVFPRKPCASKESSIPVFASMYLDMNLRAAGRGVRGSGRGGAAWVKHRLIDWLWKAFQPTRPCTSAHDTGDHVGSVATNPSARMRISRCWS